MKEPKQVIADLNEMYHPGYKARSKKKQASDVQRIRGANQIDWGSVLKMAPEQEAEALYKQQLKSDPMMSKFL